MHPVATLVIDDNDAFRADFIRYLKTQEGVRVVGEARDGFGAVALAHAVDPDLILMDISMPSLGGFEATRIIKEEVPRTKVVLVSVHAEKSYRQLAEVFHADGFVSKSSLFEDMPKVLGKLRSDIAQDS
jgi:two-component system nitrate/nitrite response regulator NarL